MSEVTTIVGATRIEKLKAHTTKYTAIFKKGFTFAQNPDWLNKSIQLCEDKRCIVGIRGGIINPHNRKIELPVNQPRYEHEVDYVSCAWLFKTEWIDHSWQNLKDNLDEISFCASCLVNANIRCMVMESSDKVISDEWRPTMTDKRLKMIDSCVRRGWNLLSERIT